MLQSPQLRIPPVSVGTMLCLNHVVRCCSPQPTLLLWMGVLYPPLPQTHPIPIRTVAIGALCR